MRHIRLMSAVTFALCMAEFLCFDTKTDEFSTKVIQNSGFEYVINRLQHGLWSSLAV